MFKVDKSLKKMLGSRKTTDILTPPKNTLMRSATASSGFSFEKKRKGLLDLAKSSVFFPFTSPTLKLPTGKILKGNMPTVNKVMKNMFGDKDKDGVVNVLDCKINNPKKHGGPYMKSNQPSWSKKKDEFKWDKENNERILVRPLPKGDMEDEDLIRILAIKKRQREKQYKLDRQKEEIDRINKLTRKMAAKWENDTDGDGVIDPLDCDPKDKKKQEWDYEKAAKEASYVVHIAPTEYLAKTGFPNVSKEESFFQRYGDMETNKAEPIQKLQGYIESKEKKVTIPYMEDSRTAQYDSERNLVVYDHEGRHRAFAAHLAGEKQIPVRVPLPKHRRTQIAKEFGYAIYPENGDYPDWRKELVEKDREKHIKRIQTRQFPEWELDLENRKIYAGILKKHGLLAQKPALAIAAFDDKDNDGFIAAADNNDNNPKNPSGAHFSEIINKWELNPRGKSQGNCHNAVQELSQYFYNKGIQLERMQVYQIQTADREGKQSNHVILKVDDTFYDPTGKQYSYLHGGQHQSITKTLPSYYKVYSTIPVNQYLGNLMGDNDNDGYRNLTDCDPNDASKQGAIHNYFAYLYHGTNKENLINIKKQGLKAQKNYWGKPAVFLSPSKDSAIWYSQKKSKNPVLLTVKVPLNELQNYSGQEILKEDNPYRQIKIYRDINPKDIKVIKPTEKIKPW